MMRRSSIKFQVQATRQSGRLEPNKRSTVQRTSWHPVLGIRIERVLDALHAASL